MRTFLLVFLVGAVALGALAAYIRLAPSKPEDWHTDPSLAEPREGHFVVKPAGGDVESPHLPLSPAQALAAFDAIALATPRTQRLAGAPEEGRITYVTRSRLWGFPDYTTVAANPAETGARLTIHARLRFGQSDLGVNRARVEAWLAALTS